MSKDPGYSNSKVDVAESRNRSLQKENEILKKELLSIKVFCESLRYSKPDGQDMQVIIDDINKAFNSIGE